MGPTASRPELPRLDTPSWFDAAGRVVEAIGTEFFHREFIRLLQASIPSEAVWVIRYSREALPDVIHTHDVPRQAERVYVEKCAAVDPFSTRWRRRPNADVLTLATLRDDSVEYLVYKRIFLAAAGMEDELSIFFPTAGQNCFAFVIERERGRFTKADIGRANLIYPALEGFYSAHLACLFNELHYSNAPELEGLVTRPTLIRDRTGQTVYANEHWTDLTRLHPGVSAHLDGLAAGVTTSVEIADIVLRTEALGMNFPLAPGGRMFVVDRRAPPHDRRLIESLSSLFQIFTPRERDILDLVMEGMNGAQIASRLSIGEGTVRNCKMRIYRKVEVATEAALVKKLTPLYDPRVVTGNADAPGPGKRS